MDGSRFDALARSLTTIRSRRSLARLLGGLSLGAMLSARTVQEALAALRNGGSPCTTSTQCKTGKCAGPVGSKKCSCSRTFPTCKQPPNPCKNAICDFAIKRCVTRTKPNGATCAGGTCQGGVCRPACSAEKFACPNTPEQLCCPQKSACLGDTCGACPAIPAPCTTGEVVCGHTTAQNPGCYCLTSVDDVTTCSSLFVYLDQVANCESDAQCAGLFGPGVAMVCVNVPCLGLSVQKVCLNKGCEDLNPPSARSASHSDAPKLQQLRLRGAK